MQKVKQLVPQLRFPEFEETWSKLSFEHIVKFVRSGKSKKEENGIYNLYGSTGVIGKTNENIEEGKYLLVARVGANAGQINFINGVFGVSDNTLIVSFKDDIQIGFVKEFLINFNLNRLVFGSGQPLVTGGLLKKIKVVIPNSKEQQKIADFLTSVDNQIQSLEKKKSLLEQYKKGLMQKIFKQELRFKDENGNAFPEWEKKKFGYLTYKVGRKNKENIQYPIYSINNQEGFRPQSEQFDGLDSNERGYDISMYKIVYEKTFAYNPARINVGSIGYSFDLNEVIISSLYVCFKTNEELEDSYLLAYLDTDRFNKDILKYQEGGVRQYLFYDNFSQIKIPLPSNKEQIKIANFLSTIDENITLVNTKIEQTKAYKIGLLQQMFV